MVNGAAVGANDAANIGAVLGINDAGVIACSQISCIRAKQTTYIFTTIHFTVQYSRLFIIGTCLNGSIVVNLMLVIAIIFVPTASDGSVVDADDTAYVGNARYFSFQGIHHRGVLDSFFINAYDTASTIFLFFGRSIRSIPMDFAFVFHDCISNIGIVFTDDAARTTSCRNDSAGIGDAYAVCLFTAYFYFILTDDAADVVFADDFSLVAIAHAKQFSASCISTNDPADIRCFSRINSSTVSSIGDGTYIFAGDTAEVFGIIRNIIKRSFQLFFFYLPNDVKIDIGIDIFDGAAVFTGDATDIFPAVDFALVQQRRLVFGGNGSFIVASDTADISHASNLGDRTIFQVIQLRVFPIDSDHAADIFTAADGAGISAIRNRAGLLIAYQAADVLAACITDDFHGVGYIGNRCRLFSIILIDTCNTANARRTIEDTFIVGFADSAMVGTDDTTGRFRMRFFSCHPMGTDIGNSNCISLTVVVDTNNATHLRGFTIGAINIGSYGTIGLCIGNIAVIGSCQATCNGIFSCNDRTLIE